ncbi:MAG: tRNA 2-thiouridine(34) synthase MnmA [Desulfobacteraceae bacterium]|jgi:tRNA-specific 2-thiouridylase
MKKTIAIALSGGIDSLVAAYILNQKGYQVTGLHFLTGFEDYYPNRNKRHAMDIAYTRLKPISKQLQIPIHVIDLTEDFKQRVISYFVETYQSGLTPNPCLVCNPTIKFDLLSAHARNLGAHRLATGHYARCVQNSNGTWDLFKGVDSQKDQSYFLTRLTQNQLAYAYFPLGEMQKQQTLNIARENGLHPMFKGESQDICFIKRGSYGDFLKQQSGFKMKPGPIVDLNGKVLGTHKGLHLFTIGQRRGINCPAKEPYYVVRLDPKHNRLVVGFKNALNSMGCQVTQINWLNTIPSTPFKAGVRVRYRHREVMATIEPENNTQVIVRFDTPQKAITPGQGAVFYHKDRVIGGGWISVAFPDLA